MGVWRRQRCRAGSPERRIWREAASFLPTNMFPCPSVPSLKDLPSSSWVTFLGLICSSYLSTEVTTECRFVAREPALEMIRCT